MAARPHRRSARPARRPRGPLVAYLGTFGGQLAAIAALGLLVRVLYVTLVVGSIELPSDRYYYHFTANALADGKGFIEPFLYGFLGRIEPTAGHPPLWSFLLSGFSLLGARSWLAHELVGTLVGAGTIVAVGLLARRIGGPRMGLLAAGLTAAYPTLIAADGSLMPETLYGLMVVLAIIAGYRFLDRPSPRAGLAVGAFIGLAAMTRSEGLFFLLFLAVPLSIRARPFRWSAARTFAIMLAGAALVITPWTIRNWIVFNEPVLISLNDATVLAGANCPPVYSGTNIGGWNITCLAPRTLSLQEPAQHRIWRSDGLRYARHHLKALPPVVVVRVLRTWDLYQPTRQARGAEGRNFTVQVIGTWTYLLLLLPLGIYGALVLRRHRRPLFLLLSPAAVVTLASAIGWGLPRLRHPFDLTLMVLDAVAVWALIARWRAQRRAPVRVARRPAAARR